MPSLVPIFLQFSKEFQDHCKHMLLQGKSQNTTEMSHSPQLWAHRYARQEHHAHLLHHLSGSRICLEHAASAFPPVA